MYKKEIIYHIYQTGARCALKIQNDNRQKHAKIIKKSYFICQNKEKDNRYLLHSKLIC